MKFFKQINNKKHSKLFNAVNFKQIYFKKKFYQRLLRSKVFFKYHLKLLKIDFNFRVIFKYLRLWASWFNSAISYKGLLYLLQYCYRRYSRKNKKFQKLYKLKKYFFNYRNFKNKRRYLKPSFFKVNSYFLGKKCEGTNKISHKNFLVLSSMIFFTYFFNVYFMFNAFWWFTKFYFKNMIYTNSYIEWLLKKIRINYFFSKQYILNVENEKDEFNELDNEKPFKIEVGKIFFYCHTYLLVR